MSFLISATNKEHTNIRYKLIDIQDEKSSLIKQSPSLTDLHHLAQLGQVAGDEVEEGELVKVLGPLVAHFHDLVVTLQQCCFTQTLPAAALIQGLGGLQSHLEVWRKRNVFLKKKYLKLDLMQK